MWREYFGFVAPALAVLNGLIAIVIALLSIRRSVLKLRLGVTALVFGIIAVGAELLRQARDPYPGRAAPGGP